MIPRYVSIKKVDNGFTVNADEYGTSSGLTPRSFVARSVEELHEILLGLYPVEKKEEATESPS